MLSRCEKFLRPALEAITEEEEEEEKESEYELERQSRLTLKSSFFDDLWPLILKDNICDTHSKNTSEFYVPSRKFDYLWAHELLASKGFENYEPPTEMRCTTELTNHEHDSSVDEQQKEEQQDPCERVIAQSVFTLPQQLHGWQHAQEQRQKLAYNFINRKHPWYIPRSIYDDASELSDEIRMKFKTPFELRILQQLHMYECKLMIIDAGAAVDLSGMERWLKFCRYAKMIVVVRCPVFARRLLLFDGAFHSCYMQENHENSWQEELTHALELGMTAAKELELLKNVAKPIMFVFAHKRGMNTFDTFKILRKF